MGHFKIEVFSFVETAFTLMSFLYLKIVGVDSAGVLILIVTYLFKINIIISILKILDLVKCVDYIWIIEKYVNRKVELVFCTRN